MLASQHNTPTSPQHHNAAPGLFARTHASVRAALEKKDGNTRIVLLAIVAGLLSLAMLVPLTLS